MENLMKEFEAFIAKQKNPVYKPSRDEMVLTRKNDIYILTGRGFTIEHQDADTIEAIRKSIQE